MRNSILTLITGILIYSCGAISKLKDGNSLVVNKIGIMDTITVNVSGRIFDLHEKFGLKGARIELINIDNLYSKTCSDNGIFKFEHITSGKYEVRSSFVGYYLLKDSIEFKSGEIIELKIGLGYDE